MTTSPTHPVVEHWFKAVEERDAEQVLKLLTPDIRIAPPFLTHEVEGPSAVMRVFSAFANVTDTFKYGRQWRNGGEVVLEFFTRIDGQDIHGVDIISINDTGQISRFDILARPQANVQKLGAAIERHLENTKG